jgi:hypothetical protein
MISYRINKQLFDGKNYDVVIIDVNSMFLFNKNPLGKMYDFISLLKSYINKDLLVINVIDNGLCQRMKLKNPTYKSNRITSHARTTAGRRSKWDEKNHFKANIDKIHRIDNTFGGKHLTFFHPGETDFKIGHILQYIHQHTQISTDGILTIANDKDMVLAAVTGHVLLKRQKAGKFFYYLFTDKNKENLDEFKRVFSLTDLEMNKISDYYYYLLLNGDKLDNIKPIFTPRQTIDYLNFIYSKEKEYNIHLICKYINEFRDENNCNDILKNRDQIDIYDSNAFKGIEITTMNYALNDFFKRNKIKLI